MIGIKFDEIASKWHFRNMMTEAVKKIYSYNCMVSGKLPLTNVNNYDNWHEKRHTVRINFQPSSITLSDE